MKTFLQSLLTVFYFICITANGASDIAADNAHFWNNRSLVYVIVKDVKNDVGKKERVITIHPIATLTGKFDCGLLPTEVLEVTQVANGPMGCYLGDPIPGDKAIILLEENMSMPDGSIKKGFSIPCHYFVDFMPSQFAYAKVSSLEDKTVIDTMSKIKKLRIKKPFKGKNADEEMLYILRKEGFVPPSGDQKQ